MKLKMYANYGVDGLKYPVYHPASAEISEPVGVIIPDEWETYQNEARQTVIVLPDGTKCLDSEIQSNPNGKAYYFGANGKRFEVEVDNGKN